MRAENRDDFFLENFLRAPVTARVSNFFAFSELEPERRPLVGRKVTFSRANFSVS